MTGTAGSLGEVRDACPTVARSSLRNRSRHDPQQGAIAIVFAVVVVVLIGFVGMSLDLGRVYNRKMDLQAVANAAALAAARQLDGTPAGVTSALARAANVVGALKYQYNQKAVVWDSAALSFSSSSTGAWIDASSAQAAPDGLLFVKADTSKLDVSLSTISLVFMRVLSEALASASIGATAVAGRSSINVAPLAICALSNTAAAARLNPGPPAYSELSEYGFRRGVGYDLMQLNPNGAAAENFVVDPFDPPGTSGAASNTLPGVVGPYVCTGKLAIPRITGAPITVSRPFPLASLFNQLNSRFDQFSVPPLCSFANAPPDTNIKSFVYNSAIAWMSTTPGAQRASNAPTVGKLWTVADPLPAPAGTTAAMYGPLWAYARAVPYSSYVPGAAEPAGGYTAFTNPGVWSTLYKPGVPVATTSYPVSVSTTPYMQPNGNYFQGPSAAHKGVANRRVLNVALLSCPVGAGATTTATVLGIGKFLMTVPATATTLFAEFGGLATEQSLGGAVELYP